jgi:catechol 2,3-dioxygenase-like lactoylglutathione lyase family enzyme
MRLDHINIAVPPGLLEEVRDFYCEVLGLREGHRPSFSSPGYWLYAEGNPVVHLSALAQKTPLDGESALDHVAFRSEKPAAVKQKFQALGVSYRETRVDDIGLTQLFVTDPAGILLEINFPDEG